MEQRTQEQVRSQEQRSSLIGFLSVEMTADNVGMLGAILVTDARGYPLEFRCTTPVRPTAIQKTLYGSKLKPYVCVELCGKRLLVEIQRKPAIILTSDQAMLALSTDALPVVVAVRAGSVIETASLTKHLNTERLESVAGHFQPIVLMSRQDQSQSISLAKSTLIDLFGIIDLLEPFDRIKTALVALAKSYPKYS